MMCSLLALAMGLALGSQIAPTTAEVTVTPSSVSPLQERLQAWVRPEGGTTTSAPAPMSAMTELDTDTDPTLEGGRQPRMPRMSREAITRPVR